MMACNEVVDFVFQYWVSLPCDAEALRGFQIRTFASLTTASTKVFMSFNLPPIIPSKRPAPLTNDVHADQGLASRPESRGRKRALPEDDFPAQPHRPPGHDAVSTASRSLPGQNPPIDLSADGAGQRGHSPDFMDYTNKKCFSELGEKVKKHYSEKISQDFNILDREIAVVNFKRPKVAGYETEDWYGKRLEDWLGCMHSKHFGSDVKDPIVGQCMRPSDRSKLQAYFLVERIISDVKKFPRRSNPHFFEGRDLNTRKDPQCLFAGLFVVAAQANGVKDQDFQQWPCFDERKWLKEQIQLGSVTQDLIYSSIADGTEDELASKRKSIVSLQKAFKFEFEFEYFPSTRIKILKYIAKFSGKDPQQLAVLRESLLTCKKLTLAHTLMHAAMVNDSMLSHVCNYLKVAFLPVVIHPDSMSIINLFDTFAKHGEVLRKLAETHISQKPSSDQSEFEVERLPEAIAPAPSSPRLGSEQGSGLERLPELAVPMPGSPAFVFEQSSCEPFGNEPGLPFLAPSDVPLDESTAKGDLLPPLDLGRLYEEVGNQSRQA
jgi:hypothetical protein